MRSSTADYPDSTDIFDGRPRLKVAQISLYRRISSCRPDACLEISETLNASDRPIQSDPMAGNGSDRLQVKNLRYSRTGVLRYAFGLSSVFEVSKKSRDATPSG
jgi:hypothetical protein